MRGNKLGAIVRYRIEVSGIVQGVGFRPFVYRMAERSRVTGFVLNTPAGVTIEAEGDPVSLDAFLKGLAAEAPPLAVVTGIVHQEIPVAECEVRFEIRASGEGEVSAEIPPDGDVCDDCLRELFDPADRRYLYPFINCTNCGPRYSIITGIPYDRPFTTMAGFALCPECREEYETPLDRRFHAQPVACAACGPQLRLLDATGAAMSSDPVEGAVRILKRGGIVAVKGTGGYHLAVDACNPSAVAELRRRKLREAKPFAVMVRDIDAARIIATPEPVEERLLVAPERPIVLLRKKAGGPVADAVASVSGYLGVMLPSTPLHHLLLVDSFTALVMTSGNRSSEPIAYRDEEALERLAHIADAFLAHNRPIRTRVDDSVIRVFRGSPLFLRRSRGYVPRAVSLDKVQPPVLAVGAELKGACCLTRGDRAFMSQHIGDLQNIATIESLEDTIDHLKEILALHPVAVAHDLHPDYLSTRFALERIGLPAIAVQHHHAHMVACMAENRIDGPVIGVIFDGTGYGPDGTIWGGEFLVGDLTGFRRCGSFRRVMMPGGDAAVNEPWRMALSWLYETAGEKAFALLSDHPGIAGNPALPLLRQMLERGLNSPLTSSCGRLFDAVASLIGVRGVVTYEGQAAIELEAVAEQGRGERRYPWVIAERDGMREVDWRLLFPALLDDLAAGVDRGDIARGFHRAVADASLELCCLLREAEGIDRVVLSGGVFQNRLLTEDMVGALTGRGFRVFIHRLVPPNDGGIALGQAVIAGNMLNNKET